MPFYSTLFLSQDYCFQTSAESDWPISTHSIEIYLKQLQKTANLTGDRSKSAITTYLSGSNKSHSSRKT